MLMGKAILILLMATAVQATAQEKAAGAPAVDPRAATRCGTFYLLLSEKAKGTEISRPYEIAARTLLPYSLQRVWFAATASAYSWRMCRNGFSRF